MIDFARAAIRVGAKGGVVVEMVSSGYSSRRSLVRRPKICIPPPPPPPPSWPLIGFTFAFYYTFDFEGETLEGGWTDYLVRGEENPWIWYASYGLSPAQDAEWIVNPNTWLAELRVSGEDLVMEDYTFVAEEVVVVSGVVTPYVIADWAEKPGADWTGLATFSF